MGKRIAPPDVRTITIGGFALTEGGLEVTGSPSFEEAFACGAFIQRAHKASGLWLLEFLEYCDKREDWTDRLDQLIDSGDVSEATLRQYRYVAKRVPPSNRLMGVKFAATVASLPHDEQRTFLRQAHAEGWSANELRQQISATKRTKVIRGQAVLEGMYRVIYADPPWMYRDQGATVDGSLSKAQGSFPGMTIDELCKLPVQAHATPDSILFMWVTVPMLYDNPGPREVMEAWGFTYKSNQVWDKVLGMPGHYGMQVKHEHLIIATRGKCGPTVATPHDDSVLTVRRQGEHSAKPEDVRSFITRHWTEGPYLELFARHQTPGWSCFGNDARLWSEDAQRSA